MKSESGAAVPDIVARADYLAQVDALRVREKAHMREADALAASRRRLPMMEIDASTTLIGRQGPTTLLEAFEGRRILIAYYFMWQEGKPAAEQCEGCTFFTTQVRELANIHSRDVTYATLCQGPYEESSCYRDFMGWTMPWCSAQQSLGILLADRKIGMMHLNCYLREGSQVYETYWTTMRGVEAMDNSYRLLDLTAYGRQETWENSPAGWPQAWGEDKARMHIGGRPIAQWPRLKPGFSDDLGNRSRWPVQTDQRVFDRGYRNGVVAIDRASCWQGSPSICTGSGSKALTRCGTDVCHDGPHLRI